MGPTALSVTAGKQTEVLSLGRNNNDPKKGASVGERGIPQVVAHSSGHDDRKLQRSAVELLLRSLHRSHVARPWLVSLDHQRLLIFCERGVFAFCIGHRPTDRPD